MDSTKAEMLSQLQSKISLFEIPNFFYFTVFEFRENKDEIIEHINRNFKTPIIVRSSSIFEDKNDVSAAGEFESVLDVDPNDELAVNNSINIVIESYCNKKTDDNQIIIQEMVKSSSMSGVIFTHDLNSGAPYYVINYDDQSGSTDTVTSGNSEYSNRTLYVHRNETKNLQSSRFITLLKAVNELENILENDFLDIEFALGDDLVPYLFQVRAISTKSHWDQSINLSIDQTLENVQIFLKNHLKRVDGVFGETTVLGQMPDWNPAEMIGRAPRALSRSLYKAIITDHAWRIGRNKMGYSTPSNQPLMQILAGQPFIDTRLSFHSYLPSSISSNVAEKLVNHWVERLAQSPEAHDKIEFDIAITAYSFDIDQKIEHLIGDVLSVDEKEEFKNAHLKHTRNLLKGECEGSIAYATNLINELKIKQDKIISDSNYSIFDRIADCIDLGTVPFSILARHGFIAKTILLSLQTRGILSKAEVNLIQSNVQTVASDLVDDIYLLQVGSLDYTAFMKKYGHLRPGTYDIMSKRYDQMQGFRNRSPLSSPRKKTLKKFKFSKSQEAQINDLLIKNDFGTFDAHNLFAYINDAIVGREYGKFIFTRSLSAILELIGDFGNKLGLSRDDISHIPLKHILNNINKGHVDVITKDLLSVSNNERINHHISSSIRLPQLLIDESGVYVIPFQVSQPNFITSKKIIAPSVILMNGMNNISLNEKIVIIEGADPGFDWIFSHKIAGLVTKYGGANSHMAIRCAEFDIPAAIGCGEQRYNLIINSTQVHLDCASGLIEPLH